MSVYPNLSIIAAVAENRVIGRENTLPWRLPADLAHFKRLTIGKPIIMGRRTWESLPGLLPHRTHVVLTNRRDYQAEGGFVVHDLEQAMELVGDVDEVFVVGGANLYAQTLPLAARLYLTHIHAEVDGDTRFPPYDEKQWCESAYECHQADDRNPFDYSFVTYRRCDLQ